MKRILSYIILNVSLLSWAQINRNNGYIKPETDDPMGNELGSKGE